MDDSPQTNRILDIGLVKASEIALQNMCASFDLRVTCSKAMLDPGVSDLNASLVGCTPTVKGGNKRGICAVRMRFGRDR